MRNLCTLLTALTLLVVGCSKKDTQADNKRPDTSQVTSQSAEEDRGPNNSLSDSPRSVEEDDRKTDTTKVTLPKSPMAVVRIKDRMLRLLVPMEFKTLIAFNPKANLKLYAFYPLNEPGIKMVALLKDCDIASTLNSRSLAGKVAKDGDHWKITNKTAVKKGYGDYIIKKVDNGWAVGPKSYLESLDFATLDNSAVGKTHAKHFPAPMGIDATVTVPKNWQEWGTNIFDILWSLSIVVGKGSAELSEDFKESMTNFGKAMLAGTMLLAIESQTPFKEVSVGYSEDAEENGKIKYHALFADSKEGQRWYREWQTGTSYQGFTEHPLIPSFPGIKSLLDKAKLEPEHGFKKGLFNFSLSWKKGQADEVKGIAAQYLLWGRLHSKSSSTPNPENWTKPVKYAENPKSIPEVIDFALLKKRLPYYIRRHLYLTEDWGECELDPLPIMLNGTGSIQVVRITDQRGRPVRFKHDKVKLRNAILLYTKPVRKEMQEARISPTVRLMRGQALGKMTLKFSADLSPYVDVFEFTPDMKPGTILRGKGCECRLDLLEGNAFKISFRGHVSDYVVIAKDDSGKQLARDRAKRRESGPNKGHFQGNVKSLCVAVTSGKVRHECEVPVDINWLRRRTPKVPSARAPFRAGGKPDALVYRGMSEAELSALRPVWDKKKKCVRIRPPQGCHPNEPRVSLIFWKDDKPTAVKTWTWGGKRGPWFTEINWRDKDKVKGATAVTGAFYLKAPESVEELAFVKKGDGPVKMRIGPDEEAVVVFNKNQLTLYEFKDGKRRYPSCCHISITDAQGRHPRIYYDWAERNHQTKRFWGVPTKVVIQRPIGKREHVDTFALDIGGASPEDLARYHKSSKDKLKNAVLNPRY